MAKNQQNSHSSFNFVDLLLDLWCVVSVVGIWPRFIEPNILSTTKLSIHLPNLPESLNGLKILQFSDLHFNPQLSDHFLKKIVQNVESYSPDIIIFGGDFLCYSVLDQKERLGKFLNQLHAPYGCYAVLGNHDYQKYVVVNSKGEYDLFGDDASMIKRGFERLFSKTKLAKRVTPQAQAISLHSELVEFLKTTPVTLLHNESRLLSVKNSYLNLCGLGEYMLGKTDPKTAFRGYDKNYPGIILLHNPDGVSLLQDYPGEIVLCGHTHGGQLNLPWLWRKFILLENEEFKKGLVKYHDKWVYVNRGVGGAIKFRWFSVPEILLLTLTGNEG